MIILSLIKHGINQKFQTFSILSTFFRVNDFTYVEVEFNHLKILQLHNFVKDGQKQLFWS